ncbi:MAG: hypothetical protein ACLFVT_08300 [Syntrophobacteria bacterium]
MLGKFKEWLQRRKAPEHAEVQVEKRGDLRDTLDQTMEAITFAEAGVHEVARELISEQQKRKRKVLVVGQGEGFSNAVVDYAIGFAERMNYEILALTVLLGSNEAGPAPCCTVTSKDQRSNCEQSIARFHHRCEERGIPFRHVVKVGDIKHCIQELLQELRRINFVVSESQVWPKLVEDRELTVIAVFSPVYQKI